MNFHQRWQALNAMALGFIMGQTVPMPADKYLWLLVASVAVLISGTLEARFNKRDVSGWKNIKLR